MHLLPVGTEPSSHVREEAREGQFLERVHNTIAGPGVIISRICQWRNELPGQPVCVWCSSLFHNYLAFRQSILCFGTRRSFRG